MKSKSISISGKYNSEGKLMISNKAEHQIFGKKWKNHRVVLVATVYAEGSTGSQIGYYFNKIVPDMQKAYKELGEALTLKETDERLREMFPGCHEEVPEEESGGFRLERIKPVNDLSITEMIEFIDHIRMIAAQEFDIVIEDPRRL